MEFRDTADCKSALCLRAGEAATNRPHYRHPNTRLLDWPAQPMKIVVLDGHTLNPGDLTWKELEAVGACEVYERTAPGETLGRSADAEIILTNKTVLTREHLLHLPKLKYIGVLATGTNVVDLSAARERGITVTNVPAYATPSVAQLTFALLLELALHPGEHSQSVKAGEWTRLETETGRDLPCDALGIRKCPLLRLVHDP